MPAARRGARLLAAALVLASLTADSSARDTPVVAESAHYRLESSGAKSEAEDWARLLEAAWPQFETFFGKTPPLAKGEKLAVRFFETNDDMLAAVKKAGGTPPTDAGGYFDPVSKTAFAWRQPSTWYTRTLILHECAHQFHRLGRCAPSVTPPAWYGEGVAEHLSHHTWDGEHLRLGVVPMLSLEDRPAKALDVVNRNAFALDDAFDGLAGADRPEQMHLVRWMCRAEGGKLRPKFDEIASRLDRGTKPDADSVARLFGPSRKVLASLKDWLGGVQQPWECVFVDWDARGEAALRGSAPVMALCRRKAETRRVTATVRRPKGSNFRAGVLLRYGGPEDYVIGMIENARRLTIDRRKNGAWDRTVEADLATPDAESWVVEGVREAGSVSFVVDGKTVGDLEFTGGSMGLAVDACTVDFTDIKAN